MHTGCADGQERKLSCLFSAHGVHGGRREKSRRMYLKMSDNLFPKTSINSKSNLKFVLDIPDHVQIAQKPMIIIDTMIMYKTVTFLATFY